MRATVPLLESMRSINLGPWWEKPLWSLRQQVEVRRTLREEIGSRHASLVASSSHLVCCTVIEEETIAKTTSYDSSRD